jgi:hypothetical protein
VFMSKMIQQRKSEARVKPGVRHPGMAAEVMGTNAERTNLGKAKAFQVARSLAPIASGKYEKAFHNKSIKSLDPYEFEVAKEYVNNTTGWFTDFASKSNRVLSWLYHFGGVVAASGTDRVTLENYARGDLRMNNPDPRWYFQMYGESRGQTFHEFYKAKQEYANPLTVTIKKS